MIGFPFDSRVEYDADGMPTYDRAISSEPYRKLLKQLFKTGIMPTSSTNMQVVANTGMTVKVLSGFAMVEGCMKLEETDKVLNIEPSDTTYSRIDTIVLRLNDNIDVRNCEYAVIKGTPAQKPVAPALVRSGDIYDIGLANVAIAPNSSQITASKITDTRYDDSRCGVVSSVSEFPTDTIYAQVQADLAEFKSDEQAEFIYWFNYIKQTLDGDVAGHLQNEINDLNDAVATKQENLSITNFKGNVDVIGGENGVRKNSVTWVKSQDATGTHAGSYYILETFAGAGNDVAQHATVYASGTKTIHKSRLYTNGAWSLWTEDATKFIADEYSSTKTYGSNEYCFYKNKLYQSQAAPNTGNVPTSSYWKEVSLQDTLQRATSLLGNPSEWNSSQTYYEGTIVFYEGSFYQCVLQNSNVIPISSNNKWEYINLSKLEQRDVIAKKFSQSDVTYGVSANQYRMLGNDLYKSLRTTKEVPSAFANDWSHLNLTDAFEIAIDEKLNIKTPDIDNANPGVLTGLDNHSWYNGNQYHINVRMILGSTRMGPLFRFKVNNNVVLPNSDKTFFGVCVNISSGATYAIKWDASNNGYLQTYSSIPAGTYNVNLEAFV